MPTLTQLDIILESEVEFKTNIKIAVMPDDTWGYKKDKAKEGQEGVYLKPAIKITSRKNLSPMQRG